MKDGKKKITAAMKGFWLFVMAELGMVPAVAEADLHDHSTCQSLDRVKDHADLKPALARMRQNASATTVLNSAYRNQTILCLDFNFAANASSSDLSHGYTTAASYWPRMNSIYLAKKEASSPNDYGWEHSSNHEFFHAWQDKYAPVSMYTLSEEYTGKSVQKIDLYTEAAAYVHQARILLENVVDRRVSPQVELYAPHVHIYEFMKEAYIYALETMPAETALDHASRKTFEHFLFSEDLKALRQSYAAKYADQIEEEKNNPDFPNKKEITLQDIIAYSTLSNGLILYTGDRVPTDSEFENGDYMPQEPVLEVRAPKPERFFHG